jgi:hypothetical protein
MSIRMLVLRSAIFAAAAGAAACVTRPPTIAHVHLGHAVTGVHVTPEHKGYVLVAERRADEALNAAKRASQATDLKELKADVVLAVIATDSQENFGVKQSLNLAANHISFAATSTDASDNVIRFAPAFKTDITAVIARCDYIELLAKDVAASSSVQEASLLTKEMVKAAQANVEGDDSSGAGSKGSVPADYGMAQLRGGNIDGYK